MSLHTFEPELDQPTPRLVAAREGCAYGCGLWGVRLFCLPHTLIGPWLLYQAVRAVVLYLGVLHAGIDIEGTITHKDERTGKKGPYYWADYVFTVNGVEYAAQTPLEAHEYAALQKGQAIPVRVWVAAPQDGHWPGVSGSDPLGTVRGLCFAALFWNGMISFIVWKFYLVPWRRRRLVRYGIPTTGAVREVKVSQEKQGPAYRISYTYTPGPSDLFTGQQSGSVRVSHPHSAADVKAGDVLTVLYDPRRPRRSLLYRFADHKAVIPITV
ncbi:MAG TPA: DUF3592 domain-containing protein [Gemmataceae bacterium]|nr:DUF3592 domain-containing protein [Gemmataceae bacterium]